MTAIASAYDGPTLTGGRTISDTCELMVDRGKRRLDGFLADRQAWTAGNSSDPPPSPPSGNDHMPFLRAIWAAPLNPQPLIKYADWLADIGLSGAAAYYHQKALDVAIGRQRPEYPDRSDALEDLD
jgi:uncharacterized protein (TIGR02996 family)